MNRFFSTETLESFAPGRAYARLDQIEPPNVEEAEEFVFAYEAADADWKGFGPDGPLPLDSPEQLIQAQQKMWRSARDHGGWERHEPIAGPFDDLPLFRLELTLKRRDPLCGALLDFGERWLEFVLDPAGTVPVDVFAGLFAAPTATYLAGPPKLAARESGLQAAFDLDAFPDADDREIEAALSAPCGVDALAVFDVGQGSASALICHCGAWTLFYDLGCGVYRNAGTCPSGAIRFCHCGSAPIVLSHWDADHWSAARKDIAALGHSWIAPRQKLGAIHKTFAADIVLNGRLLIVPNGTPAYSVSTASGHSLSLRRGSGADRNGSGLVLFVEDPMSARSWLLTGDVAYHQIPGPWPSDLAAVVAPHHGADMGAASVPPTRPSASYARLLYSFGPDNRHGRSSISHPTAAAVASHSKAGWLHGLWSPATPGHTVAGADTLATAWHLTSHLTGAVAGWTAAPLTPLHPCLPCGSTVTVAQS